MDIGHQYRDMCGRSIGLRELDHCFEPGDFLWDGASVRVVGFDWLNIRSFFRDGRRTAYFAMMDKPKRSDLVTDTADMAYEICADHGRYELVKVYNPIWLPRQDQLQAMTVFADGPRGLAEALFHFCDEQASLGAESSEQLWLMFYMKLARNEYWDWKIGVWRKLVGDSG